MKMENLLQHHVGFFCGRFFQIHPQKQVGVGQQGRHQKRVQVLAVQTALGCKCKRPDHVSNVCMPLRSLASLFLYFRTWERRCQPAESKSQILGSASRRLLPLVEPNRGHDNGLLKGLSLYSIEPRMMTKA